jgi:hypothetical protein
MIIVRNIYNVKHVRTQRARMTYAYENTKEKLLETNAAIWFNKMCKTIV